MRKHHRRRGLRLTVVAGLVAASLVGASHASAAITNVAPANMSFVQSTMELGDASATVTLEATTDPYAVDARYTISRSQDFAPPTDTGLMSCDKDEVDLPQTCTVTMDFGVGAHYWRIDSQTSTGIIMSEPTAFSVRAPANPKPTPAYALNFLKRTAFGTGEPDNDTSPRIKAATCRKGSTYVFACPIKYTIWEGRRTCTGTTAIRFTVANYWIQTRSAKFTGSCVGVDPKAKRVWSFVDKWCNDDKLYYWTKQRPGCHGAVVGGNNGGA